MKYLFTLVMIVLLFIPMMVLGQASFPITYVWTPPDTIGGHCEALGYEIEIQEWDGAYNDYADAIISFDDTVVDTTYSLVQPANLWQRVRVRGWCYCLEEADGDTLLPQEPCFGLMSEWSSSRKQGGPPDSTGRPIRLHF